MDKRSFLKITGLTAIGVSACSVYDAITPSKGAFKPSPKALPAKRWAMVVNMKKCKEDCKDCIDACHLTHNVPDYGEDRKHEIKWIWKTRYENAFTVPESETRFLEESLHTKPFLVMCNHCDNPPCVRVCPTQATFRRQSDGIVMMDYHRCIGCRFCMAGCPYGSRSFNFFDPRKKISADRLNPEFPTRMKGVVEKCNFCAERLAVGNMPACVEACKKGALVFGDIDDPESKASQALKGNYTVKRKPELGTLPMVYYIV